MKDTIQKLWYEYMHEPSEKRSAEQRALEKAVFEQSEILYASLNAEQKEKHEAYMDAFSAMMSHEVFEAFEKGVCFTVQFITEGMAK